MTLESGDFDPYLVVEGPDGFRDENDDAPGMGKNARLDAALPADGTYRVIVTTYAAGQAGAYRLRVWLREGGEDY